MEQNFPTGEMWHDSMLERITIDYNDIVVDIENRETLKLICKNYIGIEYLGQWDENVIKQIDVSVDDEIIFETKEKIKNKNIKGGGVKEYNADWKCLRIELLDGIVIYIICEKIVCQKGA